MLRVRLLMVWVVSASAAAWGHDVSLDVSASLLSTSENNPRAGSVGLFASGGWDVSDSVSLFTNLAYTRELSTTNESGATSGANVFLGGLGVLWLPADRVMTMVTVSGSPPSNLRSASTITFVDPITREPRRVDVVVDSRSWTLGGLWSGSFLVGPMDSAWTSLLDVIAGATWFGVFQQLELPNTPGGEALRQACAVRDGPRCALVNGASTPLLQARLGGGYTGTLKEATDFAVEVQGFLYDRDPSEVGYFGILNAGRALELGSGLPVLPLALSVRPSVLHRFSQLSLKLSYQWGLYTGGQGNNHVLTLRATWKVTKSWRLQATVTGQLDADDAGVGNLAGFAALGATVVF